MGKLLLVCAVMVIFSLSPAFAQSPTDESDVSVAGTPGSGAIPGQILVVNVEVTNAGPWDAEQVVLGSVLPVEVSVVDASSTSGRCLAQFGSLVCSMSQLEVGTETVVITLEVGDTGDRAELVLTFFAQVFGSADSDATNNTAVVQVPVVEVLAVTGVETDVLLPMAIVLLVVGALMLRRTRPFGVVVLSERTYTGPQAISGLARTTWQPFDRRVSDHSRRRRKG